MQPLLVLAMIVGAASALGFEVGSWPASGLRIAFALRFRCGSTLVTIVPRSHPLAVTGCRCGVEAVTGCRVQPRDALSH